MIEVEKLIIGVGDDLHAIDPANPREMIWSFLGNNFTDPSDQSNTSAKKLIRGRVQIASDGLAVPTAGGLALVSLRDGVIKGTIGDGSIGNPLVLENQVFLAGDLSVSAFMSVDNAVQALRARLNDDPGKRSAGHRIAGAGASCGKYCLSHRGE